MTIELYPACIFCQHFDQNAFDMDRLDRRCKVFPNGIPSAIFGMLVDHRDPYPNDQGIQFKLIERIDSLPDNLSTLSPERISQYAQLAFNAIELMREHDRLYREAQKRTTFQKIYIRTFRLLQKLKIVK